MIPLFEYNGQPANPLGFPMCQNRLAVPVWSYAMEKYPPGIIIEIGSLNGGFTTALGVHAWRIGCGIHSFDVTKAPNEDWLPLAKLLNINFHQIDCFSQGGIFLIEKYLRSQKRVFLLCDGGNKATEFNTFAKFLKPGDLIAAHDYCVKEEWWPWGEIKMSDVAETVKRENLTPFMQEHFDMTGWMVFKKE